MGTDDTPTERGPSRAEILRLIRVRPMPIKRMAERFGVTVAGLLLLPQLNAMRRRGEVVLHDGKLRRV